MKLNNIILVGLLALGAVSFTACSEGDGHFKNADSASTIGIDVDCIVNPTSADIATYITIYSGDVIVKEDSNSSVSTYHDVNGNKSVCRVTGNSYILR